MSGESFFPKRIAYASSDAVLADIGGLVKQPGVGRAAENNCLSKYAAATDGYMYIISQKGTPQASCWVAKYQGQSSPGPAKLITPAVTMLTTSSNSPPAGMVNMIGFNGISMMTKSGCMKAQKYIPGQLVWNNSPNGKASGCYAR